MKKLINFIFLLILITKVSAQQYQKEEVRQLIEEQSFNSVLDILEHCNEENKDTYILNAGAYAAYQMGLLDKASAIYLESLRKDSTNVQATLYLGLIKKQQRKFNVAIEYFKQLALLLPHQARSFKYIADCYSNMQIADSALYFYREAHLKSPIDVGILLNYCEALYAQKKYREVDKLVREGLLVDSNNVALLSLATRNAYAQKDYTEVVQIAKKLSEMNLGEAIHNPIMFGIYASLQLKDYNKCLLLTQYLIHSGIESEQVYYYAAKAQAGLKQYQKSNDLLKKCLEMAVSKNTESYYIEMAENYERLNIYTKAQRYYDTARYITGNSHLLYRKALAYDEVKDSVKAKKTYRDYLRLAKEPDSALTEYARKRIEVL